MTETALRDPSDHSPEDIETLKKYYLRYYDADASNLEEALDSVERDQENFKAFFWQLGPLSIKRFTIKL